MRFGSVCSGIEAASVAWNALGWKASWFSEIELFPCKVLTYHYPNVTNVGDMARLPDLIRDSLVTAPDILCGGTPCQAFSVAGLRNSLDDTRGNLSLIFCEVADAIDSIRTANGEQPAIVFWENVPGVLSTKDNAFGCLLARLAGEDEALVAPRERWSNAGCVFGPKRTVAWRILDAQYFGVAQRRKRVFVIASARERFNPVEVLFEFGGVRRDIAPNREEGQEVAGTSAERSSGSSATNQATVAYSLQGNMLGRGDTAGPVGLGVGTELSYTLTRTDLHGVVTGEPAHVRRQTPLECERLQGLPDDYTDVKPNTDSLRYKAIGNSWCVPVVRWIGERINLELRKLNVSKE